MNRTVDVVIAGANSGAVALAIEAAERGLRVLIVCRKSNRFVAALRRQGSRSTLSVMCGAEIVCADGVGALEAVVVRKTGSRKLIGVNTSQLLWFDDRPAARPGSSVVTSPRAGQPRTRASRSAESRRRRRARRSPSRAE